LLKYFQPASAQPMSKDLRDLSTFRQRLNKDNNNK